MIINNTIVNIPEKLEFLFFTMLMLYLIEY
jgi:hypothetical protein